MNISEFAKEAGVSKAAVSRYFNNGYLSEEKRKMIEEAVDRTGYSPSRASHNADGRLTKLVGVIIPKLSSDSCARIVEGISSVLQETGYEMLLVNTANDYKKEVEYLELFRKQRVDGVILLASVFTPNHRTVLAKRGMPVVIAGQRYAGLSCVFHDDMGAAFTVTEHMIERGAKSFGYIGVMTEDEAVGTLRRKGFLKALEKHGIAHDRSNDAIAEFSMDSGYERMNALLRRRRRPDALFCVTDTIASGAVVRLREQGICVPEDVMIGSVGDSKLSRALSLTTAHMHYRTEGREAARLLMSSIYSDCIPRSLQIGFELVERHSTETL